VVPGDITGKHSMKIVVKHAQNGTIIQCELTRFAQLLPHDELEKEEVLYVGTILVFGGGTSLI
jgi:hypothetical protein